MADSKNCLLNETVWPLSRICWASSNESPFSDASSTECFPKSVADNSGSSSEPPTLAENAATCLILMFATWSSGSTLRSLVLEPPSSCANLA